MFFTPFRLKPGGFCSLEKQMLSEIVAVPFCLWQGTAKNLALLRQPLPQYYKQQDKSDKDYPNKFPRPLITPLLPLYFVRVWSLLAQPELQ
jgi:hypothetical protein